MNGVTIHCLRHTGATRALQAGHSVRSVMDLGGWRLPSTVMRYLHATDIDVQRAAESIGQSRDSGVSDVAISGPVSETSGARARTRTKPTARR